MVVTDSEGSERQITVYCKSYLYVLVGCLLIFNFSYYSVISIFSIVL